MRSLAATYVLGACVALGVSACSRASSGTTSTDAGHPFDVQTMAFLSEARALHHQANIEEGAQHFEGAIAAVRRILAAPRPRDAAPEVDEVLADASARLAELYLRAGKIDAAADAVAQGLPHAAGATYFHGHLLEVQGIVEEARASALADAGRAEESGKARQRALTLLGEAVSVQQQVIEGALDGSAEGSP